MDHPQITHIERTGHPREDTGDRVRPVPIALPDNYYADFDANNEGLAAQARVEAKRRHLKIG